MDAYTKLSQTFATALSDLRRDCATSPPLASRALVPVSPPRPTANSSFSSGGAEPHHQRSRGVVDACTAHATLARLRALVESKTRSTALHAHSSSPTAPGAAAAASSAAAAAAPASAAPAATVFHTGLHAALAQLPTNTEIERAGEKLHSAVRLASKCTAAAPVEDTSIWGRAMPDNTVPLPAAEGSRSGSPSRAWRTLGAGASAEQQQQQQQQQPGALATDGSDAQLVEERLSRLYLQLLDAERRALEAACEARSLRREEEGRQQQQQQHHLSTTHSSQARQRSPSPQRAPPPPPPPPPPPLQPLSPQPHQHALLAPNSPPSPGEAVLQILRNPHLCSFVRHKPAAAPWRGSRYNAWRPNSVDYAESSRKFGRGSSSNSSSSGGGGGGGGGRRAVVPPPQLPQRK